VLQNVMIIGELAKIIRFVAQTTIRCGSRKGKLNKGAKVEISNNCFCRTSIKGNARFRQRQNLARRRIETSALRFGTNGRIIEKMFKVHSKIVPKLSVGKKTCSEEGLQPTASEAD
jgi:hypothetical protein